MIDRLINMLLWIDTTFSRTSDPVLAEYRTLQQQIIVSGALTAMSLLGAFLMTHMTASSNRFQGLVNQFAGLSALICLAVSLVTLLWFAWTAYCLWRFTAD